MLTLIPLFVAFTHSIFLRVYEMMIDLASINTNNNVIFLLPVLLTGQITLVSFWVFDRLLE